MPEARRRRFVDLPVDQPALVSGRYVSESYHADAFATRMRELSPDVVPMLLSALVALLFRLTRQDVIDIDLIGRGGLGLEGLCMAAFEVNADATLHGIAAIATAILARARHESLEPVSVRELSNIAVTFSADAGETERADLGVWERQRDIDFRFAGGQAPTLTVVYNRARFEPSRIARMIDELALAVSAANTNPDLRVRDLPLMSAAEITAVTTANDRTKSAPFEPVHRLFEARARERPTAPAAFFGSITLTYGELDARATSLAARLIGAGVTEGVAVGVCVVPSFDILVAMLAILKAGGVYFPLDPTHPPALIAAMLDDARPKVVLTQASLSALTNPERHPQWLLDESQPSSPSPEPHFPEIAPERPSHLLYTSGTTGRPKGALATQGNLAHYIGSAREAYGFSERDIFCSLARYTFSISLFELLLPLACGAAVRLLEREQVLAPDRLAGVLREVTVVHAGPSLLGSLFRYLKTNPAAPSSFPNVRHASSGGDMVAPHTMREMSRAFANAEIFVIYGCTEVSCMGCTYPVVRGAEPARTFVGKAFPNVVVRLLDPEGNLTPWGAVGEVCFAGAGVVSGYLNREELTREKFTSLSWNADGLAKQGRGDLRFYRTGDLARLSPEGELEILGRSDFQVQIRGIRVELACIESVIRELGLATQCAVVMKRLDDNDARLGAFVVNPTVQELGAFRRALAAQLPDYMLPQSLIVLDKLPVTHNGKLDRRELQNMPWGAPKNTGPMPTQLLEKQIAGAFARVLSVEAVGLDDDFFDLGGHSLLAVLLAEDLHNKLGIQLSPAVFFEAATVRKLAEHARGAFSTDLKPVALNSNVGAPAVFLLTGVHIYRRLAQELSDRFAVFGVYSGRELMSFDASAQTPSVNELAEDYLEIVRGQQPRGPYRLGGFSFGGIVAYEVAQRLREAGEEVRFVGLLDAQLPETRRELFERWVSLPRQDMVDVAWTKVRARALEHLGRARRPEFLRYDRDAQLGPKEAVRELSYRSAAAEYADRIRTFDGNVVAIVAEGRLRLSKLLDPKCGWSKHVPHLDAHTVSADHYALLEAPAVREVARILRSALDRTDSRRPPPGPLGVERSL